MEEPKPLKIFENDPSSVVNINDGKYLPEVVFLYVLIDTFEGKAYRWQHKIEKTHDMEEALLYCLPRFRRNLSAKIRP